MSLRRRDLVSALTRRELSRSYLLLLVAVAATSAVAADSAALMRASGAMAPVLSRFIVRFDLTMLAAGVLLAVLRVAQRVADDQTSGWLDSYRGSGGDHRAYGIGIIVAATAAGALMFAVAAVSFAFGIFARDGVSELLKGLPMLLAGGVILTAAHIGFATVISLALREALATFFTYALLSVAPLLALVMYALRTDGAMMPGMPGWLLSTWPPPFAVPATPYGLLTTALYCAAVATLTIPVAHRLAGRRT
ncbi:hypothetical protein BH23GEM9_BH23GEM9_07180 [soil metagenome]